MPSSKKEKRKRRGALPNRSEQNITPDQQNHQRDQACENPDGFGGARPRQQMRSSSGSSTSPFPVEEPSGHEPVPPTFVPRERKRKTRTVHPEELGIELQHKSEITPALPLRPGFGNLGKRIKVVSNCFEIEIPNGYVYHYDVKIKRIRNAEPSATDAAPDDEESPKLSIKTNRKIISLMLDNNPVFCSLYAAYDGEKNLYTRKELDTEFPLTCEIILPDENPDGLPRFRQDTYFVEIKPVKKKDTTSCAINLDSIHALFEKRTTSVPHEAIMALETILRHGPCLKYVPIGRSFFSPPKADSLNPIGGGLEIWFGYHQSIRLGQWKPTVNLDIAATAFLQEGPVLNYIADCLDMSVAGLKRIPFLNEEDFHFIDKKLKQKQVRVTHLNYPRKYRIVKLIPESANTKEIDITVNGNTFKKTVAAYFKEQHGRELEYPNLHCLQVQPEKRNIYLPVEVCELIAGQHFKGELSSAQKSNMTRFTSVRPKVRFKKIDDIVKKASFESDSCVREFNLRVSREPLHLEARILDSPSLQYRDGVVHPRDASWNVRYSQFLQGAKIPPWVLLTFGGLPSHFLKKFADLLLSIGGNLGMEIDPKRKFIRNVDVECDKVRLLSDVKKDAKLAIIVIPEMKVPEQEKKLYSEIKKAAEIVVGLTTQCIREKIVKRMSEPQGRGSQIVSNLCLKINAKMGGENHSLIEYQTPSILHKPVIIIGADLNHPPPTQIGKPSLAACVGSLDSFCKRCAVSIRAQVKEENKTIEKIRELEDMVVELLRAFYRHTRGKKPEKIIFYRDGVSEGEFEEVKNHEVVAVRKACRRFPDYEPGITFIVVQKRHHVRFKPEDERDGKNIPPGTVIDTAVSHPVNFDFFLCSQPGLLGTSRPSHYTVLEDDNDFTANDLQKLTYQLCHMYVRCTKSISIPAPVAYAHLAAYRARKHLDAVTKLDSVPNSSPCSGSSPGSSPKSYRLTEEDIEAVNVVSDLKSSMYFV